MIIYKQKGDFATNLSGGDYVDIARIVYNNDSQTSFLQKIFLEGDKAKLTYNDDTIDRLVLFLKKDFGYTSYKDFIDANSEFDLVNYYNDVTKRHKFIKRYSSAEMDNIKKWARQRTEELFKQLKVITPKKQLLVDDQGLKEDISQRKTDTTNISKPYVNESINYLNIDLDLKEIHKKCIEISIKNMSNVLNKFDASVYLERQDTVQEFNNFLVSDKKCFVLIGSSGIGKSNFIISQILCDKLETGYCVLCYNIANFDQSFSIESRVLTDIKKIISDKQNVENINLKDALFLLDKSQIFLRNKFVVIFDAINENENIIAKQILSQIDELINIGQYQWLKIVISSKPQAWKTIKQGIILSENNYYRSETNLSPYEENLPFSYSYEMSQYSENELPWVYDNYKNKYNVKSNFDQLGINIKELISDPLLLKLCSLIYADKEVPSFIRQSDILADYFNFLVNTNELTQKDIYFIQSELMPLMISDGNITNYIPKSIVEIHKTKTDEWLFDLIYNTDKTLNGNSINQSFQNLCDHHILTIKDDPLNYKITFTYERFFDFFSGEMLFNLIKETGDIVDGFITYSKMLNKKPYLWGGLINALIHQIKENKIVIFELCSSKEYELTSLLINALTDYGYDYKQEIELTLSKLFNLKSDDENCIIQRKRIALEVANNLSLYDYMEMGCGDISPIIRTLSIKNLFYYAHNNRDKITFNLRKILDKCERDLLKINKYYSESFAGLSSLLFLKYYSDEKLKNEILSFWKDFFSNLIFFKKSFTKFQNNIINRLIFDVIILYVYLTKKKILKNFEDSEAMVFDVKGFMDKKGYRNRGPILEQIVPFYEREHSSILEIQETLCKAVKYNDQFTSYVVTIILSTRLKSETKNALEVSKRLFEECLKTKPSGSYIGGFFLAFSMAIYSFKEFNEELWKEYECYIERFFNESYNECKGLYRSFTWTEHGRYLYFYHQITGEIEAPLIKRFLDKCETDKRYDIIRTYLYDIRESIVRFGFNKEIIEHLIEFLYHKNEIVTTGAIEALSGISKYYRLDLIDLLKEKDVPSGIEKLILSKSTEENVSGFFVRTAYEFWRDQIVINGNQSATEMLKKGTEIAIKSGNKFSFFKLLIKHLISSLFNLN